MNGQKTVLNQYQNGNVLVTIYTDGTQVLEYPDGETPEYVYPTSMDIHITNYCSMNCPMCHENSSTKGKHGDLYKLSEILSVLPKGCEIAIGGGDALSHPDLLPFLKRCKVNGLIPNITVNQNQLFTDSDSVIKLKELINGKLIYGLGISTSKEKHLHGIEFANYPHTVIHMIIGIDTPDDLVYLRDHHGFKKFLLLGYKTFGRGVSYYEKYRETIDKNIKEWDKNVLNLFKRCIISFDNLAIEQLNIESKVSPELWEQSYMGDDFNHTMYIDAVEEQFAPTSRSPLSERVSWNKIDFLEYFQTNRNK